MGIEMAVEPTSVGISVRGQMVVKVTAGSQAERLGVKIGWKLSHVNGEAMPKTGKIAADAITRALAAGKHGGKPYVLKFQVNETAEIQAASTVRTPSHLTSAGKAAVTEHNPLGIGAFGAFSSGLSAEGSVLKSTNG